jgi:hypothetical protein
MKETIEADFSIKGLVVALAIITALAYVLEYFGVI